MEQTEIQPRMHPLVFAGLSDVKRKTYALSTSVKNNKHTIYKISKVVAHYFNVDLKDMQGLKRNRNIVIARQCAIYFCRKYSTASLKVIGAFFNRDHSTVIYSFQIVQDIMDTDRIFLQHINSLERLI